MHHKMTHISTEKNMIGSYSVYLITAFSALIQNKIDKYSMDDCFMDMKFKISKILNFRNSNLKLAVCFQTWTNFKFKVSIVFRYLKTKSEKLL